MPRKYIFVAEARFPNPNFATNHTHFVEYSAWNSSCLPYIYIIRKIQTIYFIQYTLYVYALRFSCSSFGRQFSKSAFKYRQHLPVSVFVFAFCSMMEANKLYKFQKMVPSWMRSRDYMHFTCGTEKLYCREWIKKKWCVWDLWCDVRLIGNEEKTNLLECIPNLAHFGWYAAAATTSVAEHLAWNFGNGFCQAFC